MITNKGKIISVMVLILVIAVIGYALITQLGTTVPSNQQAATGDAAMMDDTAAHMTSDSNMTDIPASTDSNSMMTDENAMMYEDTMTDTNVAN